MLKTGVSLCFHCNTPSKFPPTDMQALSEGVRWDWKREASQIEIEGEKETRLVIHQSHAFARSSDFTSKEVLSHLLNVKSPYYEKPVRRKLVGVAS